MTDQETTTTELPDFANQEDACAWLAEVAGWRKPADPGDPGVVQVCIDYAMRNRAPGPDAIAAITRAGDQALGIYPCTGTGQFTVPVLVTISYKGSRPDPREVLSGVAEGLPRPWWDVDEGEPYALVDLELPPEEEPHLVELERPGTVARVCEFGDHWEAGWYVHTPAALRDEQEDQGDLDRFRGPYDTVQEAVLGWVMRPGETVTFLGGWPAATDPS